MKEIWGKPFRSIWKDKLIEISYYDDKVRMTNLKNGKITFPKIVKDKDGYFNCKITYDNSTKWQRFYVHRIKAEAFLTIPNSLVNCSLKRLVIHHKNSDRNDNRVENLEWKEHSEHNREHSLKRKYKTGWKHSEETKQKMSQSAKKKMKKILNY